MMFVVLGAKLDVNQPGSAVREADRGAGVGLGRAAQNSYV